MKKPVHKLLVLLLSAAVLPALVCCCQKPSEEETSGGQENQTDPGNQTDPVDQPATVAVPDFARGADVSWVSEMEHDGKTFRTADGTVADIFEVLKETGMNSIRLRVWVNPTGGWSGKDDCVALAKRATAAGMAVMIDFHYSDFFADPSRQDFPKDWASDKSDLQKTVAHVQEHTNDVLQALKSEGVSPAWIQVGNETRNGFLWPLGQLWAYQGSTPGGWGNFARLYSAGYSAAKAVFPDALVMPHINNAYDDNDWWFKELKARSCKFDAIALSHYPQTNSKMTPEQMNASAFTRIKTLAATYGVPVLISETGVKFSTESESAAVLKAFMDGVTAIPQCKGVFYWEPEVYGWWKPSVYTTLGWNAYDMGAFNSNGRPSSILNAFK